MEALGHLLFELVKIALLSFIYTAFVFLCRAILLKLKKEKVNFNWRNFKFAYKILYGILFIFSFTYYGNHGLGDEFNIPLGYSETMKAGDLYAYFIPSGTSNQIHVNNYLVRNDNLCASVDSGYIVYNLNTKKMINFYTGQQYNNYALSHNLPVNNQLVEFFDQYKAYWNGWRFWVQP